MAGTKAKGSKKGRKFGRNEKYSAKRALLGWDARNAKHRVERHRRRMDKKRRKLYSKTAPEGAVLLNA